MTVFVDTSFFKGLIDLKDEFHQQSVALLQELEAEDSILLTTNFILNETITLIRVRCGLGSVNIFRTQLAQLRKLKIIRVNAQDEENAWKWFFKDWSKLSFTDCVSFAVMKRLELTEVASFDVHFKRAGFIVRS